MAAKTVEPPAQAAAGFTAHQLELTGGWLGWSGAETGAQARATDRARRAVAAGASTSVSSMSASRPAEQFPHARVARRSGQGRRLAGTTLFEGLEGKALALDREAVRFGILREDSSTMPSRSERRKVASCPVVTARGWTNRADEPMRSTVACAARAPAPGPARRPPGGGSRWRPRLQQSSAPAAMDEQSPDGRR